MIGLIDNPTDNTQGNPTSIQNNHQLSKVDISYVLLKDHSFDGALQNVHTPRALVNEILSKVEINSTDKVLVLFNLEFVVSLVYDYNIQSDNITFYSDHDDKTAIAKHIKVNTITDLTEHNMKFDVVIGNPPFNGSKTDIEGTRAKQLYVDFTLKALTLSDTVAMVIPSLWTHKTGKLKSALKNYGLVEIVECSNHFNIGVNTCYVINNRGYAGELTLTTNTNDTYTMPWDETTPIRLNCSMYSTSILSKIKSENSIADIWYRSNINRNDKSIGSGDTKMVDITGLEGEEIKIVNTKTPLNDFPIYDQWKVITNTVGHLTKLGVSKVVEPNIGTSYSVVALYAINENQAYNLKNYLDSKIVSFIVQSIKNNAVNSKVLFSNIPAVDFSKSWTDEELYQHFDLTQDEIDYIEQSVK